MRVCLCAKYVKSKMLWTDFDDIFKKECLHDKERVLGFREDPDSSAERGSFSTILYFL